MSLYWAWKNTITVIKHHTKLGFSEADKLIFGGRGMDFCVKEIFGSRYMYISKGKQVCFVSRKRKI